MTEPEFESGDLNSVTILPFHRRKCPLSITESGTEVGVDAVPVSFFQKRVRQLIHRLREQSETTHEVPLLRESADLSVFVTLTYAPLGTLPNP